MSRSYRVCLKDGAEIGRLLVSEWCRIDLEGKSVRIASSRGDRLVIELINPSFLPGVENLSLREARKLFERSYVTSQILHFRGNIAKAAEFAGVDRTTFWRKIKGAWRCKKKNREEMI